MGRARRIRVSDRLLWPVRKSYKSASSRLLKKEYPQIREKLWKECFWSKSFCLLTAGGTLIETIRAYIETQGE